MVRFEDAYQDCKKMFEDEGYKGVGSIYQTDEAWNFFPYLEEVEYGAFIDNAVKIRC